MSTGTSFMVTLATETGAPPPSPFLAAAVVGAPFPQPASTTQPANANRETLRTDQNAWPLRLSLTVFIPYTGNRIIQSFRLSSGLEAHTPKYLRRTESIRKHTWTTKSSTLERPLDERLDLDAEKRFYFMIWRRIVI